MRFVTKQLNNDHESNSPTVVLINCVIRFVWNEIFEFCQSADIGWYI